ADRVGGDVTFALLGVDLGCDGDGEGAARRVEEQDELTAGGDERVGAARHRRERDVTGAGADRRGQIAAGGGDDGDDGHYSASSGSSWIGSPSGPRRSDQTGGGGECRSIQWL